MAHKIYLTTLYRVKATLPVRKGGGTDKVATGGECEQMAQLLIFSADSTLNRF